ncbi:TPA: hypothetical protein PNA97_000981 [Listeria monocytogenes]|nr:hypothetical protein [Listeria monocytogenes]HAA8401406.1 hypothetical protein [Listeria monocytogenes]HAC4817798.1 hypothetical protein [Listeria monocytogenes]HBJ9169571.1 hypothetical protein [Listeria monocytogenes]HDI3546271.1 hypothetical protein [Listeria monocytogenes]
MRPIQVRAFSKEHNMYMTGFGVLLISYTDDAKKEFGYEDEIILFTEFDGNLECIPESVGYDTGLKDKNGKRIFEGDIVRIYEHGVFGGLYDAPIRYIEHTVPGEQWAFYGFTCPDVKEIACHKDMPSLHTRGFYIRDFGTCIQLNELTKDKRNSVEIIGNIHDNPEYLN